MSTQQTFPWEVDWETWKALEVAPTKELVALAKQLAPRVGKSYGHKAAFLCHEWALKQGKAKVTKWWKQHKAD